MTNEEFQDLVLSQVPAETPFKPLVTCDAEDDSIEFLASNESYRAERIDSLVTVYFGRESEEVVGSLIKGVSRLLADTPDVRLEIHHDKIKLVHLFQAARQHSKLARPRSTTVLVYKKLEQVAEENDLEANLNELTGSTAP